VRELGNIIERAAILAGEGVIEPEHIRLKDAPRSRANDNGSEREPPVHGQRRARHSDEEVLRMLAQCDGHRLAAAQHLGISERTLYRRLQRIRG